MSTTQRSGPASVPAPRPERRHPAQDQADRFGARIREFYAGYGLGPDDRNGPVRIKLHRGGTSYNRITDTINVNERYAEDPRTLFYGIAHEYAHRITDRQAGFPGVTSAGQPGAVSEGLGETLAYAAMSLTGTPADAAWARAEHDPTGKTGNVGWPYSGQRPLPTHMDQYRNYWAADMGGIHHNAAILQAFNQRIADTAGPQAMADVVMGAVMTDLGRLTTLPQMGQAQVRAAERLGGPDSELAQAVRDAAAATGLLAQETP